MTASIRVFAFSLLIAVGLVGCGSSPADQIKASIAETIEAGIQDGGAHIKERTGGGVSEVALRGYETGDRWATAEITFDSGFTREQRFRVKQVDGQWQAGR